MSKQNLFYYKKSISALDYFKVLEQAATRCVTEEAAKRLRELLPLFDAPCAKRQIEQTVAAMQLLERSPRFPLNRLSEHLPLYISKAEKGVPLGAKELMSVGSLLKTGADLVRYYSDKNFDTPSLDLFFTQLYEDRKLYEQIDRTFITEELIADDASPALASIRRKIASTSAGIKADLEKYIRTPEVSKSLQEPIVTLRYDRYVVPVRADNRGEVKGLLHDTSNSGGTLFIEPFFVVEGNNKIRKLEAEEKAEIARILEELTAKVTEIAVPLLTSYHTVVALDMVFGKAKYAGDADCCPPTLSKDKTIEIKGARHPMIPKETMVPLNIMMGNGTDTIVITGPNTGGKTVFLKTLGLLSLMAKAGFPVPAQEAKLYIFDRIYADIGDEQSIEQSLSTFSSHLKNIRNIMQSANEESLVLFDELGNGTDPVEGAALAVSIIERLRKMGAYVAATTHYSELKTYALSHEGVENASFAFDLDTLSPTYRLQLGIPGKSYAFEISRHLGLPEEVIKEAEGRVGESDRQLEQVIDRLQQEKNKYEEKLSGLGDERLALKKERDDLEAQRKKLLSGVDREVADAQRKARTVIETARRQADAFLKELKEKQDKLDKATAQSLKSGVKSGSAKLLDHLGGDAPAPRKGEEIRGQLKVGMRVYVAKMNRHGTVLALLGEQVQVDCDGIRLKISKKELFAPKEEEKKQTKSSIRVQRTEVHSRAAAELDLRGETILDAEDKIDVFLDTALLDHLHSVTIIHGKGTGALRSGVHQFLKTHPLVKSFRLGAYGEGDSGITVVDLKD
ncbi:MAG: endonuclease MutS2 [Clostridia bacterium]|nr:endonuclease MutS2 [Clostridia bacterium]